MKTLILYSSVDGHTHAICQNIAEQLINTDNRQIKLQSLQDFALCNNTPALTNLNSISNSDNCNSGNNSTTINDKFNDIDTIIIGASIRYGKHRPYVNAFIEKYKAEFAKRNIKTAFFTVNLVARKLEKNTSDTNPYISKFLQATDWQPDVVDVFAGKLDYSIYGIFDKLMIKLIMKMTKGTTSSDKPIIYTDWGRVEKFVDEVVTL